MDLTGDLRKLQMTQGADQTAAALTELGRALGAYRVSLIEHGFDKDEAFDLVIAYQMMLLAQMAQKKGGD